MARQPQLYLDNNATTPLRPDAVSAMQLAMGPPSNPSSVHGYGRAARMIVEEARAEIAMLAGCRGADLRFGCLRFAARSLSRLRRIAPAGEHQPRLRRLDLLGQP